MTHHDLKQAFGVVVVICVAFLSAITSGYAPIPKTISYQGVLTDATGTVVPDGTYNLSFKLYEVAAGGTQIWEEGHSVEVIKGLFNVILGSVNPLGLPFDREYWLGVRVAGGPELTPRMPLTASAYSLNALSVADNAVTSIKIADGTVEEMDLANGAVTPPKIAPGPMDGVVLTTSGGNVVWQTPSGGGLTLPYSGSGNSGAPAFAVTNAGTGDGISGTNFTGTGVFGQGNVGVYGIYTGGGHYGKLGQNGLGVYGWSVDGNGVFGQTQDGNGVRGSSSYGDGVVGEASASNKSGVYALNTGDGYGVYARSTNGWGVAASGNDASLYDKIGDLVLGGERGEIFVFGPLLNLYSDGDALVDLDDNNNDSNAEFRIYNGANNAVLTVGENGNLWTSGTKSAVVQTANYGQRLLYAMESPGVWFEDFGEASLVNGEATVTFEPIFAEAVNLQVDYHVFLTPVSQNPMLLFVTSKNATNFTVRSVTLDGKPAEGSFEYRIIAKRRGYENVRMENVTALPIK